MTTTETPTTTTTTTQAPADATLSCDNYDTNIAMVHNGYIYRTITGLPRHSGTNTNYCEDDGGGGPGYHLPDGDWEVAIYDEDIRAHVVRPYKRVFF